MSDRPKINRAQQRAARQLAKQRGIRYQAALNELRAADTTQTPRAPLAALDHYWLLTVTPQPEQGPMRTAARGFDTLPDIIDALAGHLITSQAREPDEVIEASSQEDRNRIIDKRFADRRGTETPGVSRLADGGTVAVFVNTIRVWRGTPERAAYETSVRAITPDGDHDVVVPGGYTIHARKTTRAHIDTLGLDWLTEEWDEHDEWVREEAVDFHASDLGVTPDELRAAVHAAAADGLDREKIAARVGTPDYVVEVILGRED